MHFFDNLYSDMSFSLDLQDQLRGCNNCFVSSPLILNTNIELELLQLQAHQVTIWNSVSCQAWSLNKPFQLCLQPACYLVHTQLRAHPKLFICKLILLMSDPKLKESGNSPITFWLRPTINLSFLSSCQPIKSNVCFHWKFRFQCTLLLHLPRCMMVVTNQ